MQGMFWVGSDLLVSVRLSFLSEIKQKRKMVLDGLISYGKS